MFLCVPPRHTMYMVTGEDNSLLVLVAKQSDDEFLDAYPSVPFTPVNSFREAHAIPPIVLDQTELELKLSKVQSKDSP